MFFVGWNSPCNRPRIFRAFCMRLPRIFVSGEVALLYNRHSVLRDILCACIGSCGDDAVWFNSQRGCREHYSRIIQYRLWPSDWFIRQDYTATLWRTHKSRPEFIRVIFIERYRLASQHYPNASEPFTQKIFIFLAALNICWESNHYFCLILPKYNWQRRYATKIYSIPYICLKRYICNGPNILYGSCQNCRWEWCGFCKCDCIAGNAPKTILASAFTDESGNFQMSVKSECDSLILKASSVEIAPALITVPNRMGNYEIIVEDRAIELKEVVVKSRKIYSHGDTINYNVGSFLSQSDQSIADVLKKMPGITVSDAGQVSYQGKPIKNFYIEGAWPHERALWHSNQ